MMKSEHTSIYKIDSNTKIKNSLLLEYETYYKDRKGIYIKVDYIKK
jgi:hypothetical protein